MEQVPEAFFRSTKECATEDQTLNHNLVNNSFFKIDELGFVGKCVKHSIRIYMGCYLQFCITKKLRPVNKNLSKVHFFHILSAHAKGLKNQHQNLQKKIHPAIPNKSGVIFHIFPRPFKETKI